MSTRETMTRYKTKATQEEELQQCEIGSKSAMTTRHYDIIRIVTTLV